MDGLEDKLKRIATNVKSRLNYEAMSCTQYDDLMYEQLSAEGIISQEGMDITEIARSIGHFQALFERKISINTYGGMETDYKAMAKSHIPDTIKIDIDRRELFDRMGADHVREQFQGREATKGEVDKAIEEYVRTRAINVHPVRQAYLRGVIRSMVNGLVKITKDKTMIGNFPAQDVEEALGNLS